MRTIDRTARGTRRWIGGALLLLAGAAAAADSSNSPVRSIPVRSIAGLWDATVGYGEIQVPFQFGIAQASSGVSGWFFNGDEHISSDSGHFESGHLLLEFPSYGRRLDVQLDAAGNLSGSYGPAAAGSSLRTYLYGATCAARAQRGGRQGAVNRGPVDRARRQRQGQ